MGTPKILSFSGKLTGQAVRKAFLQLADDCGLSQSEVPCRRCPVGKGSSQEGDGPKEGNGQGGRWGNSFGSDLGLFTAGIFDCC